VTVTLVDAGMPTAQGRKAYFASNGEEASLGSLTAW